MLQLQISPRHLVLAGLTFTLPASHAAAQETGMMKANITIDAARNTGKVPPFVLGQNVEAADGYGIFSDQHGYIGSRTGGGLWDPANQRPVAEVRDEMLNVGTKMIRYPGGCLAHGFDWKQTVGRLEDRPNFPFGVAEFVEYCRGIGAEPLIIVSDYTGTPQDAADLVEYLNAPATPKYPWAMKRAEWGHPQPFGVKYFEMGNESDHGNHNLQPPKKFSASEYADWFNDCSRRMRAVDPTIQMGALTGTGTSPADPWNDDVLSGVKGSANFIIIHKYAVGINSPSQPTTQPADLLMRACMASPDQMDSMLGGYREKIQRLTGKNLPLAVTEYNALFVQDKPVPYRFALGSALFSADYVRVMMRPDSNVLIANYWQIINGYWGAMQRPANASNITRRHPAYYLFRLWGQHFGTDQVSTSVNSPRIPFEGLAPRVRPAQGDAYRPETVSAENLLDAAKFPGMEQANYRFEVQPDGLLRMTLKELKGENYVPFANLPGKRGDNYILSFDARSTGNLDGTHLGLGVMDARGYDATRSAIGVEGLEKATEWKHFEGRFATLPDNTGVTLLWRLRAGKEPVSGTLEIKNLKLASWQPEQFPAYAAVTSASSLSADGKTLYVMVFNKHHANDIETDIDVKSFPFREVKRWTVTGPSLDATNIQQENVRETESGIVVPATPGQPIVYRAPARSMTAWEFRR